MFGLIHEALVKLVLSLENGKEILDQIIDKAGVRGVDILKSHYNYNDSATLAVLGVACEVIKIDADTALTLLGPAFLDLVEERGYMSMLELMGNSFMEFVENLDNLHQNLSMLYPGMKAPSFRCEEDIGGKGIYLHYYSERRGLGALVKSLMIEIGSRLFDTVVEVEDVVKRVDGHSHDIFLMKLPQHLAGNTTVQEKSTYVPHVSSLDTDKVSELFPWHIELDENLQIVSIGHALQRVLPKDKELKHFGNTCRVVRPVLKALRFEDIAAHTNAAYFLEVFETELHEEEGEEEEHEAGFDVSAGKCPFSNMDRRGSDSSVSSVKSLLGRSSCLKLKGQMVKLSDTRILFVGLPNIRSLDDVSKRGITLGDIPVFTSARDLILTSDHQIATLNMATQLQETTAFLDRALADVEIEKERAQDLLYSILPQTIADKLAEGKSVEAREHKQSAMLFSDICGFTKLSSSVTPKEVMGMLDSLFRGLDDLCLKHGIYKYETIGDCFVAAAGVPEDDDMYAVKMAAFAIDLVKHSTTVPSPADGSMLRVRCGFHCGSVTSGVIGRERPRFNIFGDTVNTASRMESTGVPNCIQISEVMKNAIEAKSEEFVFIERYNGVEAKGKGRMRTFFLVGRKETDPALVPPQEYITAPKVTDESTGADAIKNLATAKKPSKTLVTRV